MERNIYYFGQGERLTRIEQTDTEEINEHLFTYSLQDGDSLVTHELNGVLFKTKQIIKQSDSTPKTVIKQNFLEGVPVQKTVETFDVNNELLSLEKFTMDSAAQKWIPGPINSYTYTENGTLLSLKTETSTTTSIKEYIYQFDGTTANNWVKKIITPDNTYTTRRIAYYQVGENVQNSSN
jgi:hypothetical protein